MITARYLLATALLGLAFAGPASAKDELPSLILLSDTHITRARVDVDRLVPEASFALREFIGDPNSWLPWRSAAYFGGYLLNTDKYMLRLDGDLREVGRWLRADRSQLATFTNKGQHILVLTDGKLVVMKEDFTRLGEAPLVVDDETKRTKDAHHALVVGDVAYLLDNVVQPTFVLKANVADPAAPKIVQRHNLTGVNVHLNAQWVNAATKEWVVVRSQTTMRGSRQELRRFPLDGKGAGPSSLIYESVGTEPKQGLDRWIMDALADGEYVLGLRRHTDGNRIHVSVPTLTRSGATLEDVARLEKAPPHPIAGGLDKLGSWLLAWASVDAAQGRLWLLSLKDPKKPAVAASLVHQGRLRHAAIAPTKR